MTSFGIILFAGSVLYLVVKFWRSDRRAGFPVHGWLGLGIPAVAAVLWRWDVPLVKFFLTPIVWTGYVLALDATVSCVRGRSLITTAPSAFAWMALLSIPLWLIFEAYNLRLQNWRYVGLPESVVLRVVGYLWSFATIWPAVLETADFLLATGAWRGSSRDRSRVWMVAGALMLVAPVVAPARWGAYLFGLVWVGFAFLLDRGGVPVRALCVAGILCGFIWEFWNYWAGARWVYVFPILQSLKIFEMPLPGYLGFPAFAVEVFVMYGFATRALQLPYYEVR